jgi:hypothetical protein
MSQVTRAPRGRPRLSKTVPTERIALCIEKPLGEVIREDSATEEKSLSEIIRVILKEKYKQRLAAKLRDPV